MYDWIIEADIYRLEKELKELEPRDNRRIPVITEITRKRAQLVRAEVLRSR